MNRFSLATVALALMASQAGAQTVVADPNGDGVFSLDELKVAYADLTPETFAAIDVDANGTVDADELQAAIEQGTLPA